MMKMFIRVQAENLALRQQLQVYKRKNPRPRLNLRDRLLWIVFRWLFKGWKKCLFIALPETVIKWHRNAFRLFWKAISKPKKRPGRPRIDKKIRDLIVQMATENGWGAPRIHGELQKLGYTIDETKVSNYMPKDKMMDRDKMFSSDVREAIKELGIKVKLIAPQCPWKNPFGECWVGTARRDLLDRVVVFGREHSLHLLRKYLPYYHNDRTHLGLNKEAPAVRDVQVRPDETARVVSRPRVFGLHHKYEWKSAA